ncbi:MAG: glycoside hydrolase family 43 C-terminal domain-containing protein [Balneolaceae bacterium]
MDLLRVRRMAGDWEIIYLDDTFLMNESVEYHFGADGEISGSDAGTWSFKNGTLMFEIPEIGTLEVYLMHEWDWQNSRPAIVFSGISEEGFSAWGKRVE